MGGTWRWCWNAHRVRMHACAKQPLARAHGAFCTCRAPAAPKIGAPGQKEQQQQQLRAGAGAGALARNSSQAGSSSIPGVAAAVTGAGPTAGVGGGIGRAGVGAGAHRVGVAGASKLPLPPHQPQQQQQQQLSPPHFGESDGESPFGPSRVKRALFNNVRSQII
eukprot:469721-Pelagomonas_calceolata.AAC.2